MGKTLTFARLSQQTVLSKPAPTTQPSTRSSISARLLERLERLDAEQLQIMEIVALAVARGAR